MISSATIIKRKENGGVVYTLRLRLLIHRGWFSFPLTEEMAMTMIGLGVEVVDG